jgi:hypothetical protein
MPKNVDYQKSLIYKIEHLNKPELCYVGSTSNFVKRKYNHKQCCNDENNNTLKYRTMRENGGWEAFKMVVIKEYPCNTKIELDIEEEKCRKELQANLNTNRCHITEEERKEYQKDYRETNRETILENQKNHYKTNREERIEYQKNHYEANKEIILENQKKYRELNKETIAEKEKKYREEHYECICGSIITNGSKYYHEKTKKHQKFLQQQ